MAKFNFRIKSQSEDKSFKCETCGSSFLSNVYLKRHLRSEHLTRDTKQEPKCISSAPTNPSITRIRIQIKPPPHSHQFCKETSRSTNLKSNQQLENNHLKGYKGTAHIGRKVYKCVTCLKSVDIRHKKRHRMTHMGERPYKCNFCQKDFARKERLEDHIRMHTGEKPYACQLCPKAYANATGLSRHLKGRAHK